MSASSESSPLTGTIDLEVIGSIFAVETATQIAENWRSILLIGLFNVVAGFICLLYPMLATVAAEMVLVATVLLSGILHILAGCSTDPGHSSDFYLLGGSQVFLASLMYMHPYFTLTVLTFIIAVLFMMLGSARLAATWGNPETPQRFLVLFSGVAAVAMSLFICMSMPLSKWLTIGILLGVNLINIGFARIGLALHGRSLSLGEYSALQD